MRIRSNKSRPIFVTVWTIILMIPFVISWTFPSNFMVNLNPYVKLTQDASVYSYTELKSMMSMASSRFTAGYTTTMGVYDATSRWDECYIEGLVAKAVSEINKEHSALKMVVTIGARLHPTDPGISEREIRAAFEAAEDANARYDGRASPVAVKITQPRSPSLNLKLLLSEIKILAYVNNHNHVVSLVDACTQDLNEGRVIIVTELCEGGSLENYLRCSTRPKESLATFLPSCLRWCAEIASGMEHIASKNVIHADLATRNVLLNVNLVSKITDFGLSRHLYNYQTYVKKSQQPLPWRWMAIESLRHLQFSTQSDIWSFGVTCWEIFSYGNVPYLELSWSPDFLKQLDNGMKLSRPETATEEIFKIMRKCWEIDPSQRGSFSELVEKFLSLQRTFSICHSTQEVTTQQKRLLTCNGEKLNSLQDLGYIDNPY